MSKEVEVAVMGEVKRYTFKGAAGEYVYSVDFDSALKLIGQLENAYARSGEREHSLRVQLAERDALLHEAVKTPWLYDVRGKIMAYLSAIAEPAPIAWHIGGNGYDEVAFDYPAWVSNLGSGSPAINPINDVSTLAILFRGGSTVSKGPANQERAQ